MLNALALFVESHFSSLVKHMLLTRTRPLTPHVLYIFYRKKTISMKIIIINNFGSRLFFRKDVSRTRSVSAPDVRPVGCLIKVALARQNVEVGSVDLRVSYVAYLILNKIPSFAVYLSCRKAIPMVVS